MIDRSLEAVAWMVAAGWLYKLVDTAIGMRRVPNVLAKRYDVSSVESVVVIVPGRNEAGQIGACLESLIGQDCQHVRVIAVDDRSTDGTGDIMRRVASTAAEMMEVLTIAELPEGWLGKNHAMAVAAQRAISTHAPDYLLFTDADILFKPDAIRRAHAAIREQQADHFVLLPTTTARSRGEAMMLGCLQMLGLWAVRPWRAADAKAKRDSIGVGAFNLIRTQAYLDVGGFEAMSMAIVEDLELGRRVKRAGLRQRVAYGPGLVEVHWAAGVRGIVQGMTKNIFAVFRFRVELLVLAAAWVVLFCIGPPAMLFIRETRSAALASWVAIGGIYYLASRTNRISGLYAATLPLGGGLVVYAMMRSMAVTLWHGGVTWRGTFYPLDKLRERG